MSKLDTQSIADTLNQDRKTIEEMNKEELAETKESLQKREN